MAIKILIKLVLSSNCNRKLQINECFSISERSPILYITDVQKSWQWFYRRLRKLIYFLLSLTRARCWQNVSFGRNFRPGDSFTPLHPPPTIYALCASPNIYILFRSHSAHRDIQSCRHFAFNLPGREQRG